jgi:hypothetical protein
VRRNATNFTTAMAMFAARAATTAFICPDYSILAGISRMTSA